MVVTEIRVAFGDTDPYGVVFFASYFRYFHRGIEDFFIARGLPPDEIFKNNRLRFGLPIAETNCRFLSPVRYGDVLLQETRLKSVKKRALTFSFIIRPQGEDRVVAEGAVTLVGINSHWKASPLPKEIVSRLRD